MLIFQLPQGEGALEKLSLRLAPSISRFARDGKVHFLLVDPREQRTDSLVGLKFDPNSPDGLGKDAFKAVQPLGSGTFTKAKAGHADTFVLTTDQAGPSCLRGRLKAGGTSLILEDPEIAAICFGAVSESKPQLPRLAIERGNVAGSKPDRD
jgi:hypothetical protein